MRGSDINDNGDINDNVNAEYFDWRRNTISVYNFFF
jgi:hypothetical protein